MVSGSGSFAGYPHLLDREIAAVGETSYLFRRKRRLMKGKDMTIYGGCLCGCIQFELQGELKDVAMCHCSQCRRATGTAFAAYARVPRAGFNWISGEKLITNYQSSQGVFRCFCGQCGSPLGGIVGDGNKLDWVALGAVTGDPAVRPEAHIFAGSKAPWHEVTDDLPQFEEWPPTASEFHGRFD